MDGWDLIFLENVNVMSDINQRDSKKYKVSQIETADSGKLIVILYEEAIRSINVAMDKMHYKTYDLVNSNLIKAIDIVSELRNSLDMKAGGEIAERLDAIYEYLLRELKKANIEKNAKPLEHVKKILVDLLASWKTVVSTSGKKGDKKSNGEQTNYRCGFSVLG